MTTDPPQKVYVVDNDEAVRFAISMLVESSGWAVECYASAGDFLEAHTPGEHACLVLDLNMPDMDGAELVENLIDTSHWLPIIVVTGYVDGPLAGRVRQAGVRAVLKKPFNDQLLLGHIRQALESD